MTRVILDVPKEPTADNCLAAAVTMVFRFHGRRFGQRRVAKELGDGDGDFVIYDVPSYMRTQGFISRVYEDASVCDLVRWIDRGLPSIVRVNSLSNGEPHAMIVRGYDDRKEEVLIHDCSDLRRSKFSYDALRRIWVVNSRKHGSSRNCVLYMRPRQ